MYYNCILAHLQKYHLFQLSFYTYKPTTYTVMLILLNGDFATAD